MSQILLHVIHTNQIKYGKISHHHHCSIVRFHRSHCHGSLRGEQVEPVPKQGEVVHDHDVVVEEDASLNVRDQVLKEETSGGAELEAVHHLLQTRWVVHFH